MVTIEHAAIICVPQITSTLTKSPHSKEMGSPWGTHGDEAVPLKNINRKKVYQHTKGLAPGRLLQAFLPL